MEAERGNILTENGDLLATSLPFFDLAFDPLSTGMTPDDWKFNIDSLSYCLAAFVNSDYTPGGWKFKLEQARADSNRYIQIKKNLNPEF